MKYIHFLIISISFFLISGCEFGKNNDSNPEIDGHVNILQTDVDTSAPAAITKLVFIHHSTGSAWIATDNGNLGSELNSNNYYVTECDYGWDAESGDNIGDRTDTEDWPDWFNDTKMPYVYDNDSHYDYTTNIMSDPGGENEIIMFKSCYPNSEVGDSIKDEKNIYTGLLDYFGDHTNKLFILIVPPPEINISSTALTRELASWLIDPDGWLADYEHNNVWAFDYYNVLTDPNNHHYVVGTEVQHIISDNPADTSHPDELYYYTGSNDHPTSAGHQKATNEFVPLLNAFYNIWKG